MLWKGSLWQGLSDPDQKYKIKNKKIEDEKMRKWKNEVKWWKNRREGKKVARLRMILILKLNEGKGEKDRDREIREKDNERVEKKVTEEEEGKKKRKRWRER